MIANNENTQEHPLQNLMQAIENNKSLLECPMLVMRNTFNFTMQTRMQAQLFIYFFRCNRANSALIDMKNKPTH